MKKTIQRYLVQRQLRAIARHLNDLDQQARAVEASKRHYERLACRLHGELLGLSLRMRGYRA